MRFVVYSVDNLPPRELDWPSLPRVADILDLDGWPLMRVTQIIWAENSKGIQPRICIRVER